MKIKNLLRPTKIISEIATNSHDSIAQLLSDEFSTLEHQLEKFAPSSFGKNTGDVVDYTESQRRDILVITPEYTFAFDTIPDINTKQFKERLFQLLGTNWRIEVDVSLQADESEDDQYTAIVVTVGSKTIPITKRQVFYRFMVSLAQKVNDIANKLSNKRLNEVGKSANNDPTKQEMLNVLADTMNTNDGFNDDAEEAMFWFSYNYNGGQSSNLYKVLSSSSFKPGRFQSKPDEHSIVLYMYNELVSQFGTKINEILNKYEAIPLTEKTLRYANVPVTTSKVVSQTPQLKESKSMKSNKYLLNERMLGMAGIRTIPSIGLMSNAPTQHIAENESSPVVGWVAFFKGQKLEIPKTDEINGIWQAKKYAIQKLKVPKNKESLVAIEPAYEDTIQEDHFTAESFPTDEANKNGDLTSQYMAELNGPVPVSKQGIDGFQFEVYFQSGQIDDIEVVTGDFIPNVSMTRQLIDQGNTLADAILSSKGKMSVNLQERIGNQHSKQLISERAMGMLGLVTLKPIGGVMSSIPLTGAKKRIHEIASDLSRQELYKFLPMLHSSVLLQLSENILESASGKEWTTIVEELTDSYLSNAVNKQAINKTLHQYGII